MSTGVNDPAKCKWCGGFHYAKCPLVKSITYKDNGLVHCVEFFAPNDYAPISAAGPLHTSRVGDGPATVSGAFAGLPEHLQPAGGSSPYR